VLGYNGSSLVWQAPGSTNGPWLLSGANTYAENLPTNRRLTLEAEGGPVTIGQR
jgi:hypothetical protein